MHHHSLQRLRLRTHSAQTDLKNVAEYKNSHQNIQSTHLIKSSLEQLDPVKTYASSRGSTNSNSTLVKSCRENSCHQIILIPFP